MSIAETLTIALRKHVTKENVTSDSSMSDLKSSNENPYLTARRAWNEHVGGVVSSRQTWQFVGILSLLIALASVGGIAYIGSQSKFVPYVVHVDKLGQAVAVAPAQAAGRADKRVIEASVVSFVADARLVTPDVALQRKAIFRVYSMLSPNDPAAAKMNEWLSVEGGKQNVSMDILVRMANALDVPAGTLLSADD